MTAYDAYLVVHVAAAAVWVGSAFAMALLGLRASLAGSAERAVAFAADSAWLGLRLYLPANLAVLVSGVLLVHEGNWTYEPLWIQLALAGFVVSFLTGALFFGPGWPRVAKLAAGEGAGSPAVRAHCGRLLLGTRLDLGLLLGVIVVMTAKPTGDDVGALVVTAAIPGLCAVAALALYRHEARPAAEATVAVEAQ